MGASDQASNPGQQLLTDPTRGAGHKPHSVSDPNSPTQPGWSATQSPSDATSRAMAQPAPGSAAAAHWDPTHSGVEWEAEREAANGAAAAGLCAPEQWEKEHADALSQDCTWKGAVAVIVAVDTFEGQWRPPLPHAKQDGTVLSECFQLLGYDLVLDLSSAQPRRFKRRAAGPRYDAHPISCGALSWNQVKDSLREAYATAQEEAAVVLCITTRGSCDGPRGPVFEMQQQGDAVPLNGERGLFAQVSALAKAAGADTAGVPLRRTVVLLDVAVPAQSLSPVSLEQAPPGIACLASFTPTAAPIFMLKVIDHMFEIVEHDRRDGGWPLTVETLHASFDDSEEGWARWIKRDTLEEIRRRCMLVERAHSRRASGAAAGHVWGEARWDPIFCTADSARMDSACLVHLASSARAQLLRGRRRVLLAIDRPLTNVTGALEQLFAMMLDGTDGLGSLGLPAPEQLQPLQVVIEAQRSNTYIKAWEVFRAAHGLHSGEMQHVDADSNPARMTVYLKLGNQYPNSSALWDPHTAAAELEWKELERRYTACVATGEPFYFGTTPSAGAAKEDNSGDDSEQWCRVFDLKLRVEGVFTATPSAYVRLLLEARLGGASVVLRERMVGGTQWQPNGKPYELTATTLAAEPGQSGKPGVPAEHAAGIRHLQDLKYNTRNQERVARAMNMDTQRAFHSEQQGVSRADPNFRALCDWLEITPAVAVEAAIRIQSVHRMAAVRTRFRRQLWQLHGDGHWPLGGDPDLEWRPPDGRAQRRIVRRWLLAASHLLEWRLLSPRVEVLLSTGASETVDEYSGDYGGVTQEDTHLWQGHHSRVTGVHGGGGLAQQCATHLTQLVRQKNPSWQGAVEVVLDSISGKFCGDKMYCRLRVLSEWAYPGDQVPVTVHNHLIALAHELESFLTTGAAGRGVRENFRVRNARMIAPATPSRTQGGMARTAADAIRDVLGTRTTKWRSERFHGELTSVELPAEAADTLWPAVTTYARRGEVHPRTGEKYVELYACNVDKDSRGEVVLLPPERDEMQARLLPERLPKGAKVQEERFPEGAGPFMADQWALVSWVHKHYRGWYTTEEGGAQQRVPMVITLSGDLGTFEAGPLQGVAACVRPGTGSAVRVSLLSSEGDETVLLGTDEGGRLTGWMMSSSGARGGPFELRLSGPQGVLPAAGAAPDVHVAYVQRGRYVEHAVLACRRVLASADLGEGGETFRRMLEAPLLPGRAVCSQRVEVCTAWLPESEEGPSNPALLTANNLSREGNSLGTFLGVEFEGESTVVRLSRRPELRPGMHATGVDTRVGNAPRRGAQRTLSQREVLQAIHAGAPDAAHTVVFEVLDWNMYLGSRVANTARTEFSKLLRITEVLDCAYRQGKKQPVKELPGVRRIEKTPYIYYSRYWADEGYADELPNYEDLQEDERIRMLMPTVVALRERNRRYTVGVFRDTWRLAHSILPERQCCGKRCCTSCQVYVAWLLTYACLCIFAWVIFGIPRVISNLTSLVYNYEMVRLSIDQVTTWLLLRVGVLLLSMLLAGVALAYIRVRFAFRLRSVIVFACAKYSRLIGADLVFQMRNADIRRLVELLFETLPRLAVSLFIVVACLVALLGASVQIGVVSMLYLLFRLLFNASYDMFLVRHMTAIKNIEDEEQLKWIVLKGPPGSAGNVAAQLADDNQMRLMLFAREKKDIHVDNTIFHVISAVTDWVLLFTVPCLLLYLSANQVKKTEDDAYSTDMAQQIHMLPFILYYYLLLIAAWRSTMQSAAELVEHRSPIARVLTIIKYVGMDRTLVGEAELEEIDQLLNLSDDDERLRGLLNVSRPDQPTDAQDGQIEPPSGVRAEFVTHMRGRITTNRVLLHIDWLDQILNQHTLSTVLVYICFCLWIVFALVILLFCIDNWVTECETMYARCHAAGTAVESPNRTRMPLQGDFFGRCSLLHPIAYSLSACANNLAGMECTGVLPLESAQRKFTAAIEYDTWQSGRVGFYKRFRWNTSKPCPDDTIRESWTHYRVIDELLILEEENLDVTFNTSLCFQGKSALDAFREPTNDITSWPLLPRTLGRPPRYGDRVEWPCPIGGDPSCVVWNDVVNRVNPSGDVYLLSRPGRAYNATELRALMCNGDEVVTSDGRSLAGVILRRYFNEQVVLRMDHSIGGGEAVYDKNELMLSDPCRAADRKCLLS
eukprot:TRINITY_DN18470_c0_g1_i1.p1 TRINITY_DN18470_c0_g1~~TRINITY_DN18470_c0_g1_i1.p1  ORF type:complete len:2218 (+),score=590.52 TRINITY_DN18470_c0_g1_i1:153-6656(+)